MGVGFGSCFIFLLLLFGLGVVVLSFFLSVFAYVVAPDNSPSGNEQVLQLETHPPGF